MKLPPGAHEVPGDENDNGDHDDHQMTPIPTSDNKPDDKSYTGVVIENDKVAKDDDNNGEHSDDDDHPSDDNSDDGDGLHPSDDDDEDDDGHNEVKLPPGAHEVPSEDNGMIIFFITII